jgi:hypothetical protein
MQQGVQPDTDAPDVNSEQARRRESNRTVTDFRFVRRFQICRGPARFRADWSPLFPCMKLAATTLRSPPADSIDHVVQRFNVEKDPSVGARIVAGFGTDRNADGESITRTIDAAFSDPAARVRHAATAGASKLGTRGDELLIGLLGDSNPSVRLQAIASLARAAREPLRIKTRSSALCNTSAIPELPEGSGR